MSAQTTTPRERQQQAIYRAMSRETWNVTSRSGNGTYAVSLTRAADGIRTSCTCPATGVCHHRAQARLAHIDAIPSRNEATCRIRPRGGN